MSATSNSNGRRARAVALIGPQGSGKSTLFEAMLTVAGTPPKRATDGRNRVMGTELRVGHCSFMGDPWAILDCPGNVEFGYEASCALAVADVAVIVVEPDPARAPVVAPLFHAIEQAGIPAMVFVNKVDTLGEAPVRDTLAALQAHSRRPLVLREVPIREGGQVVGYVDLVSERAYRYRKGQPSEIVRIPDSMKQRESEARAALVEALADHDDTLLEKVLEDAVATPAEIFQALHADVAKGAMDEVLMGAAERQGGVLRLWKALRHDTPDVTETMEQRGLSAEGDALAQVFKTQHAGHAGRFSYVRVWRGQVKDGATLGGQRVGGVTRYAGGEAAKASEAAMGEIVALGRLDQAKTGAILAPDHADPLPFPATPAPVYAMAVHTLDRKDDVRLSGALQRMTEEDPSLGVVMDADLGQTLITGQGDIHVQHAIERLAAVHGVKVGSVRPQVAYRETIRRPVREHARMKRQTGGHGQFADVTLEIAPRGRGAGFEFIDRIVGGVVPRKFIPAVGEAAEEAARKGPLGYPVVDISVALVDGGFHSVDSSDMAFANATRIGMSEGLSKADPVLLEPVDHVTVLVPNDGTAAAQRLLTGRRGQILGYAEKPDWPGWDEVQALVPEAELHDLIIELRSHTMGLGTYTRRFDHLAESRGK